MTETIIHAGGCLCAQVRLTVRGAPLRQSLCHCLDCRKRHGAPMVAFAIYRRAQVTLRGQTASTRSSGGYERHFCPACGSPVLAFDHGSDETELYFGSFDEPALFAPDYECWTIRREPWLGEMPTVVRHFDHSRPPVADDGSVPD
jgi:hypothetical protein